jgi:hypothetical protein
MEAELCRLQTTETEMVFHKFLFPEKGSNLYFIAPLCAYSGESLLSISNL